MLPAEVVARARSQIGLPTRYELGRGGFYPSALTAADAMGRCDCSGFVAWIFKTPRHVDIPEYAAELGNWVETSAIVRDAKLPYGMFNEVPLAQAEAGMVIVYGDNQGHQGHVGIVVEVGSAGPTSVVHCSKGNYLRAGDAIQETDPAVFFHHNAIVARRRTVEGATA